jgi:HD-like signal output (HDOD) protein
MKPSLPTLRDLLDAYIADRELVVPMCAQSLARVQGAIAQAEARGEALLAQLDQEPALAAAVLRDANGPVYHGLRPQFGLDAAVERIGRERALQLAAAALRDAPLQSEDALLASSLEGTWRHSLLVATVAQMAASELGRKEIATECHLLGLFSDLGAIFLIGALADGLRGALPPGRLTATAKRDVLVELQDEYGTRLLEAWSFPAPAVRVLAGTALAPEERERALVLRLARQLVAVAGLHPVGRPPDPGSADALWETAEILACEDVTLASLQVRTEALLPSLAGDPGSRAA